MEHQKVSHGHKVSTIDGKKNKYASYQDVYELIRGEVPGIAGTGR